MLGNIVLEISCNGLDMSAFYAYFKDRRTYSHVWRVRATRWEIIDDFITREEEQSVRIALESFHHSERPVEVRRSVAATRVTSVNTFPSQWRVDVD